MRTTNPPSTALDVQARESAWMVVGVLFLGAVAIATFAPYVAILRDAINPF